MGFTWRLRNDRYSNSRAIAERPKAHREHRHEDGNKDVYKPEVNLSGDLRSPNPTAGDAFEALLAMPG